MGMKRLLGTGLLGLATAVAVLVALAAAPIGDQGAPATRPIASAAAASRAPRQLSDDRIAAVAQAWRGWLADHDIAASALAIALPDGRVIGEHQGRDPDQAMPVASLSKAITGLCLDQILAAQGLGWQTPLAAIAPQMQAAGLTPRPWNADITLAALATHRAGLAPDLTQGDMMGRTHGALGLHRRVATAALAQGALGGQPGDYFYANTNYAVLGVVIEALSGESYAQTCLQRVVAPAGVTGAVIEGRMGSMSSYAGWEISARDYARLARHWFAPEQAYRQEAGRLPAAGDYRIGYYQAGNARQAEIWHDGRLCRDRATREGHGALFTVDAAGVAIAVNWNSCIPSDAYGDLRGRLRDALAGRVPRA